jgi:hypothetical protein
MPDQFRIVRYRAADRERVFDLVRAVHPPDRAEHLIRQWNWKYDRNPFNREAARDREAHRAEMLALMNAPISRERFEKFCRKWGITPGEADGDDGPYILLMKNRDQVVAMQCSVALRFMIGGQPRWVLSGCDLAVHPEYRNQRLALPLTNRLLTEHKMMLSWLNASIHRIRRGWRNDNSRKRGAAQPRDRSEARIIPLAKPLDAGYLARRFTGSTMLASAATMLAAAARPLARLLARPATIVGVRVAEIDSPGAEFDELWTRVSGSHPVIGVRDRRFLNWRFVERPDASYRFLAALRDSKTIGYLIFRIAEVDGARWGYIVDFLVDDLSVGVFHLLLDHAEVCLRQAGAKVIVCAAVSSPYRRAMMRRGFLPSRARRAAYLSTDLNSADAELQVFADLTRWFVTMADGDLEMSF